jgi:hypothetical protein
VKNNTRSALASLDQVVHVERHEFRHVPGADPQADATIKVALEAARRGNSWVSRFRAPRGTRISSAVRGG